MKQDVFVATFVAIAWGYIVLALGIGAYYGNELFQMAPEWFLSILGIITLGLLGLLFWIYTPVLKDHLFKPIIHGVEQIPHFTAWPFKKIGSILAAHKAKQQEEAEKKRQEEEERRRQEEEARRLAEAESKEEKERFTVAEGLLNRLIQKVGLSKPAVQPKEAVAEEKVAVAVKKEAKEKVSAVKEKSIEEYDIFKIILFIAGLIYLSITVITFSYVFIKDIPLSDIMPSWVLGLILSITLIDVGMLLSIIFGNWFKERFLPTPFRREIYILLFVVSTLSYLLLGDPSVTGAASVYLPISSNSMFMLGMVGVMAVTIATIRKISRRKTEDWGSIEGMNKRLENINHALRKIK